MAQKVDLVTILVGNILCDNSVNKLKIKIMCKEEPTSSWECGKCGGNAVVTVGELS